jgi:diguanylate cyclase (GGDEF)-like protein
MSAERRGIEALEEALAAAEEKVRRLEAQLRNLADHDPLTDLRNRQSMEQAIEEHVAGCVRYGPAGALLLLSLDGLDDVIRTLGSTTGDELRVAVADAMSRRLRATDIVARWADDELAVLLPRASQREVQVVASALLEVVAGATTRVSRPGVLTASVGVAFVTADEQVDDLVVRASMAMLSAKRSGGARTVIDSQRQSHLLWLSRGRLHQDDAGALKSRAKAVEAPEA